MIFTASQEAYCDAIVNLIDPDKKLFSCRLYRDNCVKCKNKVSF